MNPIQIYSTSTEPAPVKTIEPDASTVHGMLLATAEALYGEPEGLTPEARLQ